MVSSLFDFILFGFDAFDNDNMLLPNNEMCLLEQKSPLSREKVIREVVGREGGQR